jgi:hypothetical protein
VSAVSFGDISDLKRQPVQGFPTPMSAQMEQGMPNKAKSKSQFRFLQGVKHGAIQAKGLSEQKAGEMLGHQSPKGLPSKVKRHSVKFPRPDHKPK